VQKTTPENEALTSQSAKFEATLGYLKQEAEDKNAELRAVNEEIEHLGKQVRGGGSRM
jgi:hypothetical protein